MYYLGGKRADIALYLENKPKLADNSSAEDVSVTELIAENGNHWRKILTIFAKLCCAHPQQTTIWREYRDQSLLKKREQICFTQTLCASATIHIISGKASWQRFAINEEALAKMQHTTCNKVHYRQDAEQGLLLYTPYLDYRQFPNQLINEVVTIMATYQEAVRKDHKNQ